LGDEHDDAVVLPSAAVTTQADNLPVGEIEVHPKDDISAS
jgi:hypothetical protein